MNALVSDERFEEAALTRDRLAALSRMLRRRQTLEWLSTSGRMVIAADGGIVTLNNGRLVLGEPEPELDLTPGANSATSTAAVSTSRADPTLLDRRRVDELMVVARWLDRETTSGRARLLDVSGAPTSPSSGGWRAYEPVSRRGIRRGR